MLLHSLFFLFPVTASAIAQCYAINGSAVHDVFPCEPNSETSICCTSNGLCLNAHDNQAWSQQGCTDKNWSQPCLKHCDVDSGYPTIFECEGGGDFSTMKACCGNLIDCCVKEDPDIFSVAVATSIWKAPTGTTSTSASSAPSSTSHKESADSSSASSSTSTSQAASDKNNSKNLAIGLGVGIPAAAFVIAGVLFYFARQIQQRNNLLREQLSRPEKGYDMGVPAMVQTHPAELSTVMQPRELES
ncbi:hypothetical protein BGZ63DRAFT_428121 [Mariannaea sp. PMI_226]|nr:hypothetical protein BGZ63DRAFT_428121 [Mariannaea sp. PMI_226]